MDFSVYLAMAPEQVLPEGLRKAFLFCPFEENGIPESLPAGAARQSSEAQAQVHMTAF